MIASAYERVASSQRPLSSDQVRGLVSTLRLNRALEIVGSDSLDGHIAGTFSKIMLRDGTVEIIPVKPMHRDGVLDFDQRLGDRINNH